MFTNAEILFIMIVCFVTCVKFTYENYGIVCVYVNHVNIVFLEITSGHVLEWFFQFEMRMWEKFQELRHAQGFHLLDQ
jgi:hypothetical protein